MDGDAIIKDRLQYLRNQIKYLRDERAGLRTFDQYGILMNRLGDFDAFAEAIRVYLAGN